MDPWRCWRCCRGPLESGYERHLTWHAMPSDSSRCSHYHNNPPQRVPLRRTAGLVVMPPEDARRCGAVAADQKQSRRPAASTRLRAMARWDPISLIADEQPGACTLPEGADQEAQRRRRRFVGPRCHSGARIRVGDRSRRSQR